MASNLVEVHDLHDHEGLIGHLLETRCEYCDSSCDQAVCKGLLHSSLPQRGGQQWQWCKRTYELTGPTGTYEWHQTPNFRSSHTMNDTFAQEADEAEVLRQTCRARV